MAVAPSQRKQKDALPARGEAFRRTETSSRSRSFFHQASPLAGSELVSERSFTSGGLLNVLREASPLAAFRRKPKEAEGSRRKRTCFEKSTSFGFLNVLREASPLAAF